MARIVKKEFTSSGTWTCPAGVTKIITIGCGGGAGGSYDGTYTGGGGSEAVLYILDVVPNTSYTVTIGAGGAGGTVSVIPGLGGASSIGTIVTWEGAGFIRSTEAYSGAGATQSIRDGDYGNCSGGGNNDYCGGPSNRFDPGIPNLDYGSGSGGAGGFGDGADGGVSSVGGSAAANTGAGGGAGDAAENGGAGGSGYIEIIWSE